MVEPWSARGTLHSCLKMETHVFKVVKKVFGTFASTAHNALTIDGMSCCVQAIGEFKLGMLCAVPVALL